MSRGQINTRGLPPSTKPPLYIYFIEKAVGRFDSQGRKTPSAFSEIDVHSRTATEHTKRDCLLLRSLIVPFGHGSRFLPHKKVGQYKRTSEYAQALTRACFR